MTKQMNKPTLQRLLELHQLLLDFQAVDRITVIPAKDHIKFENDAEHSYSLAMTAWFLAQHFPELDRDKVIRIALAHDLVEVHSGDTSVFDHEMVATKEKREARGTTQLAKDWPDFPQMHEAITDYKKRSSEEARFVYALDKIMPIILNIVSEGLSWRRHGVTLSELHAAKKDKVTHHPVVADYYQQIYSLLSDSPHYFVNQ